MKTPEIDTPALPSVGVRIGIPIFRPLEGGGLFIAGLLYCITNTQVGPALGLGVLDRDIVNIGKYSII